MSDLNQTADDLCVLARGGEPAPEILERRRTVGEVKPMAVLHEAIAHRLGPDRSAAEHVPPLQ